MSVAQESSAFFFPRVVGGRFLRGCFGEDSAGELRAEIAQFLQHAQVARSALGGFFGAGGEHVQGCRLDGRNITETWKVCAGQADWGLPALRAGAYRFVGKADSRCMEVSHLAGLGKVAGIGGVALGVVLLVLRPVIEQSAGLPQPVRGWLLLTIAVGAFVIGLAGMVLWWLGSRPGAMVARAEGDDSPARNIDRGKTPTRMVAKAKGNRAPAINERGK